MNRLLSEIALGVILAASLIATAAAQNANQAKPVSAITWTDPATGLMWTTKDNAVDVNWTQAKNYCDTLKLGGYSNWRLATVDELAGIYEPAANHPVTWYDGQTFIMHVKGNLQLSGWTWSGSSGSADGEMYDFGFGNGEHYSDAITYSDGGGRALCVRKP